MENTRNSTSRVTDDHDSQEESTWTMYFEDFFANNNKNNSQESSFSFEDDDYCTYESSSLISDAASSVAKGIDQQDVVAIPITEKRMPCNRSLSFKKRKTIGVLVDDALEDTASSPANSPNVHGMMNKLAYPKEKDNLKNNNQEKGSPTSRRINDHGRDIEVSSTELKKRGLCLVPLSVVLNHLG